MSGIRTMALLAAASSLSIGLAVVPVPARAQGRTVSFHIPAGSLADALRAIASASGRSVAASSDLLAGKRATALNGDYTVEQALKLLLAGSGLEARAVGTGFVIEPVPSQPVASDASTADILITGSRIRGAPVASPVISVGRQQARESGQATLGDVVRSIPQSFGGGQNPGIGLNVPALNGVDAGGGSSLNLRGLGSDATLTLLNGHRLAYGGSRQAVDVSVIPLGALDRIEVVADGASALYGSDAVGGVANIILRRDLDGIEARAMLGGATGGGDFDQQYGLTAGTRWQGGGIMAAYEFNRTTAIDASDRDYASRSRGLRLMPAMRSNSALVSGHQQLAENLEFNMDGLFNQRHTLTIIPVAQSGALDLGRTEAAADDRSFVLAPSLSWTLGNSARIEIAGSYGEDSVHYLNTLARPATPPSATGGCYCNRMVALELSGDTPLFALPGGDAKLALGVGARRTGLESSRIPSDPQVFDRSQASTYGFAELDLPLVAPSNAIPAIARLNLDTAVRYERYTGIGAVATPKFGLIWSPVEGLELRASWGKSFRAPTLQQRYQSILAFLYPAALIGGTGYPAGATALYVQGGNPDLKPERATSWSLGAALKPVAIPGLSLELSYFSIRYVDRIVAPIGFVTQALSDPLYAPQVNKAPSLAEIAAIRNAAAIFTLAGVTSYDPTRVVAIADNSSVNAASQLAHGLDAILSYRTDLGPRDVLMLDANASYLVSNRQISSTQPVIALAGILFNPPRWRARGSVSWQHGAVGATATLNYIGDLADTRSIPAVRLPRQATIDLALRARTGDGAARAFQGLEVILAARNLLDTPPPPISTTLVTETPYDSTNYSPIGRFISLTVAKKW